ncbi:MAG: sulfatase-like hydrolase/transferase [Elusimicrobiaceae bacterium]|nr:sulfatase-like hydrolase/transferase [Elusimicrobiaceae bacterium]
MKIKNIFIFCVLEMLLWSVLSLAYFFVSGFYSSLTGGTFTALFILGNSFMFAVGLFALLSLVRFIGHKTAFWTSVALGSLFNLILCVDILVYSQYRFHISLAMLQLFFGPAGREIFVFPPSTYFILAGAILLLFFITFALAKCACKININSKKATVLTIILLLIFASYNGMYAWGKFMLVPSVLSQVPYLPWAQPLSMNRRLRKMGFTPKTQPYETPKKGALNYPLSALSCQTPQEKPNILFILIDAWRADAFTPEVMPHTFARYQKAKNAFYFKNHLSGGNATEAGVFSLFYSMPYPYWESVTANKIRPVFMERLGTQGYEFGIYASAKINSPEFNQNVFSHIDHLRVSSNGKTKWQRDEDAQKEFLSFLEKRDKNKPFFGFLFYDSAHGFDFAPTSEKPFAPYAQEVNYLTLNKNTDPTPYQNRYKNSVHYMDSLLAKVYQALEQQGLEKNTLIVLTGDHGQELNDTRHNFWGHNSNFAKYQTQVPLIIWWPNKEGKDIDYRTSHYDVVPTLLRQIFNCTNPISDYSSGWDLFDATPRPWTLILSYTNKAIREGDKISVLNNYGSIENYDENYVPSQTPVSAKALSESLKEFSHFYK